MKKTSTCLLASALAVVGSLAPLSAQATVPGPFKATTLATGLNMPTGLDSALHRGGAGPLGDFLYVAESAANRVVRVDIPTGMLTAFAPTGPNPTELGCYGGPFAQFMYVATATGIERIDSTGIVMPFALAGQFISDVDFGKGKFGQLLYAAESPTGLIWEVDSLGNANVFAMLPGTQPAHLVFGQGGRYGHDLYVSDPLVGNIWRVDSTGLPTLFATVQPGLEALTFGPGGAFGKTLYAGNRLTGDIVQVAANGTWVPWGNVAAGVADIHFMPGGKGGAGMCVTDGVSDIILIQR